MSTNPDPLLTVPQVAEYLGIGTRFVWHELSQGNLTRTRLGRSTRVRRSELERYIADCAR